MSVTSQTESRTVDRILGFTRDYIMPRIQETAYNVDPASAIFFGRGLLPDAGAGVMSSAAKETQDGGESIVVRLNLGKNLGFKRKSGPWDTENTAPSDTLRFARANWKFAQVPITISGHDLRTNRGDSAISSVVEHETTNAMMSIVDGLTDDIYENNSNPNAISCLDDLIGVGTVQGINPSTYAYFASRGLSARGTAPASVSFAGGGFSTTGISNWRKAWNNASEGVIQPTVLLTTYAVFEFYETALQGVERITDMRMPGEGGFRSLQFKSAPVIAGDKVNSGYTYFLNQNYIKFITLSGSDFTASDFEPVQQQDARVSQIRVTGNLVVLNRKFLNKVTGQTS